MVWLDGEPTLQQVLFFVVDLSRSGCLAEIKWTVCNSNFQSSLYVSFSRTDFGLCIYHFSYGQISISCTIPSGSHSPPRCATLIYFLVNLLHFLIVWLIVSSLSPHNLHLQFSCVLCILAFMKFLLMMLFNAAIRCTFDKLPDFFLYRNLKLS